MTTISKKNFTFYPIDNECKDIFKCAEGNLSDFHCFALCKCADAIAEKETIFADNHAWWDEDNSRMSLYMTTNGILMYEDCTENKLYRVEFNK